MDFSWIQSSLNCIHFYIVYVPRDAISGQTFQRVPLNHDKNLSNVCFSFFSYIFHFFLTFFSASFLLSSYSSSLLLSGFGGIEESSSWAASCKFQSAQLHLPVRPLHPFYLNCQIFIHIVIYLFILWNIDFKRLDVKRPTLQLNSAQHILSFWLIIN